jgi:hypothetical protein
MTAKTIALAALVSLSAFCIGLTSCESAKGRRAAVQYAYSWEQTIKVLSFGSMSDLREVERQSRSMEQEREWLRAEASESTQSEARQLDALILYVARCLNQNIKENAARSETDAAHGLLPVNFPDANFNQLLGLDPKDGDASAERSLAALHAAVLRFAEKVGVGGDFKDALRRKEESEEAPGNRKVASPPPTWAQVRDMKLRAAQTTKAALTADRNKIENQTQRAKAPSGFGPAKWLMHPEEVKGVCPNATVDSDGNLVEKTKWLGRGVKVEYKFENGFLVTIHVAFEGKSNEADFAATQQSLESSYKMSAPEKKMEEFALYSNYSMGVQDSHLVRFGVLHILGKASSGLELIIFSREDFL